MPLNSERVRTESFCPTDESNQLEAEARQAIYEIVALNDEKIGRDLKRVILRHLLWQITVAHGKYRTRYRSAGVCDPANGEASIEHEHVFPLKGLIEKLIKKADSPKTIVEKAIGCVVTENEHRELSKHKKSIGWERYADAKVAVYDMESTPRQYKVTPDGKIIP